jgi:chromosome segregation ATPase
MSASSVRLRTEVDRLDAQLVLLRTQISEVSMDLLKLQQACSEFVGLDARVSALYGHADNVTAHLRELSDESRIVSAAVNESGVRLTQVEMSDERHRKEIDAMRSALRAVVDDLGDRVTQLTVRLNEL